MTLDKLSITIFVFSSSTSIVVIVAVYGIPTRMSEKDDLWDENIRTSAVLYGSCEKRIGDGFSKAISGNAGA